MSTSTAQVARGWRAALAILLMASVALMLGGCGDDARDSRGGPMLPWPEENAPSALVALSNDLLAFQARAGRNPNELAELDRTGQAGGGPYAGIGYAYHPAGLGVLPGGWRIVAADDRIREANQVWCVLRPPTNGRTFAALRVALVPMPLLRDAASAAGGIH